MPDMLHRSSGEGLPGALTAASNGVSRGLPVSSWQWGGGRFRGYWDAGARKLAEQAVNSRMGAWVSLRSGSVAAVFEEERVVGAEVGQGSLSRAELLHSCSKVVTARPRPDKQQTTRLD